MKISQQNESISNPKIISELKRNKAVKLVKNNHTYGMAISLSEFRSMQKLMGLALKNMLDIDKSNIKPCTPNQLIKKLENQSKQPINYHKLNQHIDNFKHFVDKVTNNKGDN